MFELLVPESPPWLDLNGLDPYLDDPPGPDPRAGWYPDVPPDAVLDVSSLEVPSLEVPGWWGEPEPEPEPVGGGLAGCPPSGLLFDVLAGLVPAGLDAAGLLDAAAGWERLIAHATAQQARVLARFAALRPGGDGRGFSEFAADELALELRQTVNAAGNRLGLAVEWTSRLPGTLAALDRGEIDPARARVIAEATVAVSAAHARLVEERVLARAGTQNAAQVRAAVRRAVLAVDPGGAEQRHRRSVADRRVGRQPLEDGMAELGIYAAAPQVGAAYAHVDRLARAARTARVPGDDRTLDQLRADLALDLLAGRTPTPALATAGPLAAGPLPSARAAGPAPVPAPVPAPGPGPVAARVQVTVAATTLLGLDELPGELAGYGPIPAALARELAHHPDSTWRRLLTDPASGTLLDHGRTIYRPPKPLADHIHARDVTCVFPGCRQPAHTCDLDHCQPYPHGPTAATNLGALCRHHHRLKQRPTWTLTQPQPGSFIWTTPTGRAHARPPQPLTEPPPAPPAPPALTVRHPDIYGLPTSPNTDDPPF